MNPHSILKVKLLGVTSSLIVALMVLTACNPFSQRQSGPNGNGGGQGGTQNQQKPAQPAPPQMEKVDGFWRPNTLPDPLAEKIVTLPSDGGVARAKLEVLSLDSDGESARAVLAWLPPVNEPMVNRKELATQVSSAFRTPWIRIFDMGAQEVIEPYLGEKTSFGSQYLDAPVLDEKEPSAEATRISDCVCSGLPPEITDTATPPESVGLFYADLPAPTSDTVSVAVGDNAGVFENVSVSHGEVFKAPELTEFDFRYLDQDALTDTYGSGALGFRRIPFDVLTESVTNVSVSKRGDASALNVSADVLFAFDSDKLNKNSQKTIDSIADQLKKSAKGQTVTVEGHTDDEGDDAYNMDLSERRAKTVRDALEPKIKGSGVKLQTKGYGESKPIVPNRDSSGKPIKKNQAKNRRVSFSFKPQADIDPNVDTGKSIKDLPTMKPGDSSGGIAAGVLPHLKESDTPEMNFDVKSLEESGSFLKLTVAVRTSSGTDESSAYGTHASDPETKPFGPNPFGGWQDSPTLANVTIWDKKSNLLANAVTAGPGNCLCSQSAGVSEYRTAWGEPVELYAYFPKEGITSDTLTLRVADTAQLEIDRNATPKSSAPRTASPTDPSPMTSPTP